MANTRINLLTGTSGGTPVASSPQRVWNLYPSVDPYNKTGMVWRNTPGWSLYTSLGSATIWATEEFGDALYIVADRDVIKIDAATSITVVGTIGRDGPDVSMAQDGVGLVIADGANIYHWDGTTFSTVATPAALTRPTGIVFHDGHYVCYQKDSGQFWISAKFDGTSWDALDFATAEDKPDNITGLLSDRVLWIFGEYTTQAYYNSGEAFPFKPNPQGKLIYGMLGETQVQMDNTAYWLARAKNGTLKVVRANGFVPMAVSSPQLEEEMATLSVVDDAYANTIMWEGHEWYVLTFPTANRTFVLDTQGAWFEWGEYDAGTDSLVAHPMRKVIYWQGKCLFTQDGMGIHQLEGGTYNHNGEVMVSRFRSSVMHVDEQRLFLNEVIMDMRTGFDEDEDAVMELRWSTDGGYSYSSWVPRELGRGGEHRTRVRWHRLGSGFNYVLEGRITDEVPRQIMSAVVSVDVHQPYLERRNERAGVAVNQYETGQ